MKIKNVMRPKNDFLPDERARRTAIILGKIPKSTAIPNAPTISRAVRNIFGKISVTMSGGPKDNRTISNLFDFLK
ncbi:MAG: hypothetical protein U9R44_03315 [Candidatus Omnitrophota bacterium]|nr:hypothetical protein [Candidatus Omnitrophota bacterium]